MSEIANKNCRRCRGTGMVYAVAEALGARIGVLGVCDHQPVEKCKSQECQQNEKLLKICADKLGCRREEIPQMLEKMDNETANNLVEKFNQQFPVGSTVSWRPSEKSRFRLYKVQYAARVYNNKAIAWIIGYHGNISIGPQFVKYD